MLFFFSFTFSMLSSISSFSSKELANPNLNKGMSFAKNFRLNSKEVFDDVNPVNDYFKWLKKGCRVIKCKDPSVNHPIYRNPRGVWISIIGVCEYAIMMWIIYHVFRFCSFNNQLITLILQCFLGILSLHFLSACDPRNLVLMAAWQQDLSAISALQDYMVFNAGFPFL